VAVKEWNDEIIFLHKVRPGGTDRSYGIQVARLAGLPPSVIARARRILADLESEKTELAAALESEKTELSAALAPAGARREPAQLGLFPAALDPIVKELSQLDVGGLTPLQALNLLAAWQERLRERP
jgi:DNA mismatch repair protein MutS